MLELEEVRLVKLEEVGILELEEVRFLELVDLEEVHFLELEKVRFLEKERRYPEDVPEEGCALEQDLVLKDDLAYCHCLTLQMLV